MKVLIDIPEELYTETKDFKNPFSSDLAYNLRMPVANGIVLDGITNGEVLMKMFHEATIEQVWSTFFDKEVIRVTKDGDFIVCDLDWWNSKWGE